MVSIQRARVVLPSDAWLPDDEVAGALRYLRQFGYIGRRPSGPEIVKATRKAQKILGVKQDGILGEVTAKAMDMTPRCGCIDVGHLGGRLNVWAKPDLSYNVIGYVRQISKQRQEELLVHAWEEWEAVCGIRLTRSNSDNADILIDVSASRREEFGQAGNVLAWAQIPPYRNTRQLIMKFDLAENWHDDFFKVVAEHEFGHLLGISHTTIDGELMFPTYNPRVIKPQPRYDIPESVKRYPVTPDTPTKPLPGGSVSVSGRIMIDGVPYELQRVN